MSEDNNTEEKSINYAWNWFEYHASQRFASFNYFLILIGVVVVGYLKCIELAGKSQYGMEQVGMAKIWWALASAIAIFGIIISIAFWFLDIRNEELVNCGRNALELLEQSLGLEIRIDDTNRNCLDKSQDRLSRLLPISWIKILSSHHIWLRVIMLLSASVFTGAAVCAIYYAFASSNSGDLNVIGKSDAIYPTYIICKNFTLNKLLAITLNFS
ncbi:MAG: hypothetical protein WA137_04905 [Methanothrix sp.]